MAIKVQGVDKLRRKLRELPDAMEREIFSQFEKGAIQVTGMMRSLAPIDDGALRASIGWGWGEPGSADKSMPKPGGVFTRLSIWAGDAKAFYARWVEFGVIGRAAQPFFFPAWRSMRKKVMAANKRAMSKVAKRIAAGGN